MDTDAKGFIPLYHLAQSYLGIMVSWDALSPALHTLTTKAASPNNTSVRRLSRLLLHSTAFGCMGACVPVMHAHKHACLTSISAPRSVTRTAMQEDGNAAPEQLIGRELPVTFDKRRSVDTCFVFNNRKAVGERSLDDFKVKGNRAGCPYRMGSWPQRQGVRQVT